MWERNSPLNRLHVEMVLQASTHSMCIIQVLQESATLEPWPSVYLVLWELSVGATPKEH